MLRQRSATNRPPGSQAVRSLLVMAVVLLAALGLAACGATVSTSSFSGESKAVAQRISEFQSNATASDQQKVCEHDLAASVKAKLRAAGSDCETALKKQLAQIDIVEMKVVSVAVSGVHATAVVESTWSGKARKSTVALVKESGSWRIAGLV